MFWLEPIELSNDSKQSAVSSEQRKRRKNVSQKAIHFTLCAMLFALCLPAQAQQPRKVPRVGYLWSQALPVSFMEAFKGGLQDHGYVIGRTIALEHRSAEGKRERERVTSFIAELVGLEVDAIVVTGTGTIQEVKKATSTIPIIMAPSADAVASGLVDSLARPGGNVTGLTMISPDLAGKRVELLREILPRVVRIAAVFLMKTRSAAVEPWLKETEAGAKTYGLKFRKVGLDQDSATWEGTFKAVAHEPGSALIVIENATLISQRERFAQLAWRYRLPTVFSVKEHAEAGGLVSYGPDLAEVHRRAAYYVDKILKGSKPAELPVEQPKKFELVINLKTANQIGLTIPPNVLARADKVIK
jgi:putative ABC transport system substrate-binding protein